MCARCRRNLLAGERFRLWREASRRFHPRAVCALCERDARHDGWVRAVDRPERESAAGLRGVVRLVA